MKKPPLKIILVSLFILAGIGVAGYYFLLRPQQLKPSQPEASPLTVEDRPIGEIDYGSPTQDEQNPALDSPPIAPASPQEQEGKSIPVNITYADGSPLQVRVVINEIISQGNCTLVLQRDNVPYATQTAETFPTSSSTTCKGFTVNTSSLSKGTYRVTVTVTSGTRSGTAEREVSI